jgi:hypothetical protein
MIAKGKLEQSLLIQNRPPLQQKLTTSRNGGNSKGDVCEGIACEIGAHDGQYGLRSIVRRRLSDMASASEKRLGYDGKDDNQAT